MSKVFKDRVEAGKLLAHTLHRYMNATDTVVLSLTRGGVPTAYEVATFLNLPLDILVVKKLCVPEKPSVGIGAIALDEICVINHQVLAKLNVDDDIIQSVIERDSKELVRQNVVYRKDRPMPDLKGKKVILVDAGIATGATIKAAILALEKLNPKDIIVATPVAPQDTLKQLERLVDKIVCLSSPYPFYTVGNWYEKFPVIPDKEIIKLLNKSNRRTGVAHTLSR